MEVKLIELRDRATFITAFAFQCSPTCERERYLLRRAGFSFEDPLLVMLGRLEGGECHYDAYDWSCDPWRTVQQYLQDNWDNITSGEVLDAEFLRCESTEAKKSEQVTRYE